MKISLRPKDNSYYGLFTSAAENLANAADLLGEICAPNADIMTISDRLTKLEHDSDALTHELYNLINSTFVTPFDRDDICVLGSRLDDVMDHIEAAGTLVHLYGLSSLPALPREMHELIDILQRQANLTTAAMPKLKNPQQLRDYWVQCGRMETEGDRVYRMLLVRLFSGEYNPMTVLKLKDLAAELEAACDAFDAVANTVQTIAVKES